MLEEAEWAKFPSSLAMMRVHKLKRRSRVSLCCGIAGWVSSIPAERSSLLGDATRRERVLETETGEGAGVVRAGSCVVVRRTDDTLVSSDALPRCGPLALTVSRADTESL